MGLYIYGFTDRTVDVTETGLEGAEIVWHEFDGVAIATSTAPEGTIRPRRKLLAAHQAVVTSLASQTDTLPAAFGLVCEDEDQLASLIASERDAILTQLHRVGGCVEMTVGIAWDVENPFAHMMLIDDELKAIGAELAEHGEEAPHQLKVTAGRRVERLLSDRHLYIAQLFDEAVAPVCQEATVREGAAETELFSCTLLVRRDDEGALDRALERLAGELDEDYIISVKGPFAPHSFVDLQLSFDAATA